MTLSRQVAKDLRALYQAYRRGEVFVNVVAKAFREALGETFTAEHERLFLLRVLSRDAKEPSHTELNRLYKNYVSGKVKAELTPANVVRWCLSQTKGRARVLLQQILGPGYGEVMRRAFAHEVIPEMNAQHANRFKAFVGKPNTYQELRRDLQGYGQFFEADHLLEKRFLKSDRVVGSLDPDNLFAYPVPKNHAVAQQLKDLLGDEVFIPYVHVEKTNIMNRLIPHGAEDLFTTQQWWDAHIHAFESLDTEVDNYLPRLKEMFKDIPEKGRGFKYRTGLPDDHFFPGKWPHI